MMKTKKLFILFTLILMNLSMFSQKPIDISGFFQEYQNISYRNNDFVENAVYLQLNITKLNEFYRDNNQEIKLILPISKTDSVEMILAKFKLFTDDFILKTSEGDVISNYKKGKFFNGRLLNKKGFATINIFKNELSGIISIEGDGNYNFGKLKNSRDKYIIYNDRKVKVNLGIACGVTEDYDKSDKNIRINNQIQFRSNCVKFYLEGDYALYQDKGTISNTADFMTGLFAEMATLYSNENIDIEIKEIMIWTSADGYSTSSSSTALDQFQDNNQDKNADLCHLFALGGNNLGGLAWIDVLCDDTNKFAYSNISSTYQSVPTYSWSVECITHETGHNFGSKHTHDCVWGENNDEQIDDCGPESGNPGNPGDCYDSDNPKLPNKGTIMSYCHLISSIGIDFNLGFGQEPGDLIRNKYSNASCLTACDASSTCDIPVNLTTINITGTSATLDWEVGASGSKWEVEYGDIGFSLGSGTNASNITNTYLNISGLNVAKSYDWYIRTDCGNGDYSNWVGPKSFTTVCEGAASTTLPFVEDWEYDNGTMQNDGYISCDSDKNWYFETTAQGEGRVKWGNTLNSSWIITGDGSLIMDRYPNGVPTTNHSTLTVDLSSYSTSNDLELRFKYMDLSGDESDPEDNVSVRGDDSESWILAYDLDPGNQPNGNVKQVILDLDNLLNQNSQSPGSSLQIRLSQKDNYAAPSDGIVFDDIEIIDCDDNLETIPYETDFSGAVGCWSIEDIDKDGYTWKLTDGSSCDADYFGLEYTGSTSPSTDMNDWLFSPGIELTNGNSYRLTFSIGNGGLDEKLEIFLSDENSSTDALGGTLLYRDENISDFECKESVIDFTAPSSGIYYISFHGYSDANTEHNLYIDDFKIDDSPNLNSITIVSNTNNTCDEYSTDGVAGNCWHSIYSNGSIVAAINPNGQFLGTVTVQMRDGGPVEIQNINGNNVKTIPRYFNFESDNTFQNDVEIRLYLLKDELDEYNTTAPTTSDEITDLQINHYDGTSENCDWSDNADDGTTITQAEITTGNINTIDYFMEFSANAFSEFIIRQDGANILPLIYDLTAERIGDYNKINWKIYEDDFIEKIILQKRGDFSKWENVKTFSKIKNTSRQFSFKDLNPLDVTYYRLKFIDYDGITTLSKVVDIRNNTNNFKIGKLFPNPTNGLITLEIQSKKYEKLHISIINILNQQVYLETSIIKDKHTVKKLNLSSLEKGLYFVTFKQGFEKIVRKLIIK